MGYFACHSNYTISMLCCAKYNETCRGEDSTAPENKNEFQKRQHYQSYTIKTFHRRRNRVKNDLYMSWWNSKVVFVPVSNTVCVGGSRRQISPVEGCHFTRGSSFSQANSLTGTIAGLTEHTLGCDWLVRGLVGHSLRPGNTTSKHRKCSTIRGWSRGQGYSEAQQEDIC